MTLPRRRLVSVDTTPYYHCVSRCVRRAFLCGIDRFTGRSFEHRRDWIEDRLHELANIFAIDLCGYAVMSNHYHVVLRIDRDRALAWPAQEVVRRWNELYGQAERLGLDRPDVTSREIEQAAETIELWRTRLHDLSWFMRALNEPIARQANAEDGCKGRFWEGRFKSQALLDEQALFQCLAYVDLNPIRAAIAKTPEDSDHTALQARIENRERSLVPFSDQAKTTDRALPMTFADYLRLVDWTGRAIRSDKRGAIPEDTPPILERLKLEPRQWVNTSRHYGKWYYRVVGTAESLKAACKAMGQNWFRGSALGRTAPT